jgi:hypothetical protein
MSSENQRAFFRIDFPLRSRPALQIGKVIARVTDCSEGGLCYSAPGVPAPAVGDVVEGRAFFHRGLQVAVRGTVLRLRGTDVVVELEAPGIPFSVILSEQRYLRDKYPIRFDPPVVRASV